ncbi:MAG TPA: DUF1385 domain-containing protein [Ruminococcaceae bacterium]|nr:DUF1385 domain-containing protein [Oscillospiraceae bacterium]
MGKHKTSIGGQAVIEGVMMRGSKQMAVAVRIPDGLIEIKKDPNPAFTNNWFLKLPVIRGCVAFFQSLVLGVKTLMYSASFFELETQKEKTKFESFIENKFGNKLTDVMVYFSVLIAVAFSIGIFFLLPTFVVSPIKQFIKYDAAATLIEGLIRILIFVIYLFFVSKIKDIQRVYEYHGAEHKTIFCYESGEELTVENAKKFSRLHPRCGTNFLLVIMVVSMVLFSFISWNNPVIRVVIRLALLPVVAGIAYEIIKFMGRYQNKFTNTISYPGMLLQKLTTREPDELQLEVAITALEAVLTGNPEDDKW